MKYKFLAVWAIAAVWSGCYDDKGNYAYSEINEISIDTVGKQTDLRYISLTHLIFPLISVLLLKRCRMKIWSISGQYTAMRRPEMLRPR